MGESDDAAIPAELAVVRAGEDLDWGAVATYLRAELRTDVDLHVLQFPNGSANLTYLLQFGKQQLVLRRPPFGLLAPGAHDMRREFRTLSTLWRSFDKAPRGLLLCSDMSVVGAEFLIMEYRPGVVVRGMLPPTLAVGSDPARRIGFAVVDALAELHSLRPDAVGLGDLGRPAGFVDRQLSGWQTRWNLAAPAGAEPRMNELAEALAAAVPRSDEVAILHNDYKLDNCQFKAGVLDRVHSVFDWDMATLGDPLMDLGTLLNYWPDPSDTDGSSHGYPSGLQAIGLPSRAEVVRRYHERTGADISHIAWYEAFACWRTAIIMQQLYARYLRGETSDKRMASRGERIGPMARRALELLERGPVSTG